WDFQLRYRKHFRFIPVLIPLTQPNHHIRSFLRHCFSNRVLDGVFPTSYNDFFSLKVQGHRSALRLFEFTSCAIGKNSSLDCIRISPPRTLLTKRVIPSPTA